MLRYQLIESLPRIILYLYFCSLVDLAGLIRKAYREVFDRFVYDLVTLAVIIDPIGTAAIFAALSQSTPPGGRRAMAVRGTAIAAGICVAFAFGGEALLRAMGVSLAAFQAAGGALLFLLATDMVFAHESGLRQPTRAEANICVNEAAVIVAGFQYREIKDVSCLPDCFSRPVSEYAIYLNDFMMHRVRNELLAPFVARLPGTLADRSKRLDRPPQASKQRLRFYWGVSAKPSMSGHPRNVRQSWAEDAKPDKMIVGRESGSAPDAGGTHAGCTTFGK